MNNTALKIHITGHKHPDTDSIVAAISYTELKNKLKQDALACRLGEISHETKYILERFDYRIPMLLEDARMTLADIDIDDPIMISPDTTIYDAWMTMTSEKKPLTVVDNDDHLLGMVTNSNLTSVAMGDTAKSIELLQKTPIEYIAGTLKGELVYRPEVTRLNGKVSIIAIAEKKLENYELKDRAVIVGNDMEAQMQAIEKDAACLVVVWAESIHPLVIEKAKEKGCAIIISGHGTLNTSRYIFYASPVKFIMSTDLVCFKKEEYVDEALMKLMKSRYRSYPVIDEHNRIFGLVSRFHLLNARKRKVILVDHNEVAQSVDGVLESDLLEVIDHHRIGDIQTNKPITFRNQLVGSTNTILTTLYDENRIEIDKNLAGLMCAAIISDTLNFKSPTTTMEDIHTAQRLARLAEIDLGVLAHDIFTKGSGLKEKSPREIIENDIKEFPFGNYRVRVGQISLYDVSQIEPMREAILKDMEVYIREKRNDLLILVFTSLENNNSAILYAGKERWIATEAFKDISNDQLVYYNLVSRKKEIIPLIASVIENH